MVQFYLWTFLYSNKRFSLPRLHQLLIQNPSLGHVSLLQFCILLSDRISSFLFSYSSICCALEYVLCYDKWAANMTMEEVVVIKIKKSMENKWGNDLQKLIDFWKVFKFNNKVRKLNLKFPFLCFKFCCFPCEDDIHFRISPIEAELAMYCFGYWFGLVWFTSRAGHFPTFDEINKSLTISRGFKTH